MSCMHFNHHRECIERTAKKKPASLNADEFAVSSDIVKLDKLGTVVIELQGGVAQ